MFLRFLRSQNIWRFEQPKSVVQFEGGPAMAVRLKLSSSTLRDSQLLWAKTFGVVQVYLLVFMGKRSQNLWQASS